MNILVTFLTGEKTMPIFRKIKFVCKLMHFECDNAENAATRRYVKTNEFYSYESDKEICHCGVSGEERYNHQQPFTTASRQGHVVVKVLALRCKNRIKTFCKYVEFCIKP